MPKIEHKARAPLLAELRVKDLVVERLKANEQDTSIKFRTLRAILKTPYMYQEFVKAMTRMREADHMARLNQHRVK